MFQTSPQSYWFLLVYGNVLPILPILPIFPWWRWPCRSADGRSVGLINLRLSETPVSLSKIINMWYVTSPPHREDPMCIGLIISYGISSLRYYSLCRSLDATWPNFSPYPPYLPWTFFVKPNLDWLPIVYGMSSLSSPSSLSSLESVVLPLLIAFRRLWSAFQQENSTPNNILIAWAAIKQKKCRAKSKDGIPQPGAVISCTSSAQTHGVILRRTDRA